MTATAGKALSDSKEGFVNEEQAKLMSSLVDIQRDNLYAGTVNIVQLRTDISELLRELLKPTADKEAIKTEVLELSAVYGELDGEDNYAYASVFAEVYQSLDNTQKTKLMDLRRSLMSGTYNDGTPFDFTLCETYYLYSAQITDESVLSPYIDDTDYLFFEP